MEVIAIIRIKVMLIAIMATIFKVVIIAIEFTFKSKNNFYY